MPGWFSCSHNKDSDYDTPFHKQCLLKGTIFNSGKQKAQENHDYVSQPTFLRLFNQ